MTQADLGEKIQIDINQQAIRKQWRNAGLSWGVLLLLILTAFYNTARDLVMAWWDKPEYNHCLLILPIIAYLLYERREMFSRLSIKPSWLGIIPVLGGGLLWLLGDLTDTNVVRQLGFVVIIQGSILMVFGLRAVHAMLFPILYMYFLIPFGDFLIPALQDFTTDFAVFFLHLINIPVYVDGVFLSIPAGNFHVAEACAGLRFLVATVALGLLMANVSYKTYGRRAVVVILSFVIPVIANGFRATGIILIAHYSDMKYAVGTDHITFGWIFFAFVLLIFISIAMTFTNRSLHDSYINFDKAYWKKPFSAPLKNFVLLAGLSGILAVAAPLYGNHIEQRYGDFEKRIVAEITFTGMEDASPDRFWKPSFQGASQEIFRKLVMKNTDENSDENIGQHFVAKKPEIDFYLAYYPYQSSEKELIRFGNGFTAPEGWNWTGSRTVKVENDGRTYNIGEDLIHSRMSNRVILYWYWVDGTIVSSRYQAKLLDAKAKLFGGRLDSAVIAFSAPVSNDNIMEVRKEIADLISKLPPLAQLVKVSE